jgi:hypothetical protein
LWGACGSCIRKTPPDVGTAPGASGMVGRSWIIAEVLTHLLNGLLIEPTLPNALVDSPTVSPQLARTDIVMSTLMVEHE